LFALLEDEKQERLSAIGTVVSLTAMWLHKTTQSAGEGGGGRRASKPVEDAFKFSTSECTCATGRGDWKNQHLVIM